VRPHAARVAAASWLVVALATSIAACGTRAEGGQAFECKCHESEDATNVRTMAVCASNDHEAVALAKHCQGTASNAACTCEAVQGPCKSGGCR
jgi:hypothetical protein